MGVLNWMMHRTMKSRAEEVVKSATTTYSALRAQNLHLAESELRARVLDALVVVESGKRQHVLDTYGTSLHGIGYFMGIYTPPIRGMIVSRCIQFTQYVDLFFESCVDTEFGRAGFTPPSREMKRGYFKALGFPEDAVDKDYLHPS
jgi:hypothetical protein